MSNEIQESLGRNYNVPDDIDEEDLMGGEFICCIQNYVEKKICLVWLLELEQFDCPSCFLLFTGKKRCH